MTQSNRRRASFFSLCDNSCYFLHALFSGISRNFYLWPVSAEALLVGWPAVARPRGVWTPPLSSGATHETCTEPMRKYWGTPPPSRNVVHANTLVLVAHLVTFSKSQWDQFHPRAKKPTAPWDSPWPPSAAPSLDPAGDSAAHSSPCTFSLTPHAELRQNKQPKRSPHHYICYKSLHL